MIGILGKKIGMTQVFTEDGRRIPVTLIQAGPCSVEQIKKKETDGYGAIKLALSDAAKKNGARFIKEFRLNETENYQKGDIIKTDIFKIGGFVDISGLSLGKGFQGGVKRWHWKGGPASHGSTSHRRPGSIGSSTTPSRVFRGHHLPGHMGQDKVTVQNLLVVKIYSDKNIMAVKGAVPGCRNSYLVIRKATKKNGNL